MTKAQSRYSALRLPPPSGHTRLDTLEAAAPHPWTPKDYKGIKIPESGFDPAAWYMFCWGFPDVPSGVAFDLVERVAGAFPSDVYCS